jgi:proteic killer suppression protein
VEFPDPDCTRNTEPIHTVATGTVLPKTEMVAEIECLDALIGVHKLNSLLKLTPVTYQVTFVIRSFRHKGLERFFLQGTKAGIRALHASKLRLILSRLHASVSPDDMNLPGLHLHQLKGRRRGTWSVRVSGNWRITFKFEGPDAVDVNYEDYH